MDPTYYMADAPPTVVVLAINAHFEALTNQQKLYAHHLSRAAFLGTRITLRQVSPESESIYDLIIALYRACDGDWQALQEQAGIDDYSLEAFLQYAAQFLANAGNYKGFGDSKFVPRIAFTTFEALASQSVEAKQLLEKTKSLGGGIYSTESTPALMHLGYPDRGHLSAYYPDSPKISQEEIKIADESLARHGVLPENTRLRKLENGNFELLIASASPRPPPEGSDAGKDLRWDLGDKLLGQKLELVFGDHSHEMSKIAIEIEKAGMHAANETQKLAMEQYAISFKTGSIKAFKASQKLWVKDKAPVVESNIGFIESYRDPAGVRGEWEGFVAIVNKERTRAFSKLVDDSPKFIPLLPWTREFEKENFQAPDFTSLEVLGFAGSGIPAGINIPNYEDVREEGFKNVSLGNVLSAKALDELIPFISAEDLSIYQENRDDAFEVQVGIHELLGHGSGRLLQETSESVYNFDFEKPPVSPLTNRPVTSWYKPGETWSSVFGSISSSYEECRAELVAMALSCNFEVLQIFGFGDGLTNMNGKAGDVLYASYLSMARAGIVALEFWDPKSKKWGQAHMQARYSILKTFLNAGGNFAMLDYSKEDLSDLAIKLDRNKILTHGRPAVEKYLQKLHIFKCTKDLEAGTKLYEEMTHVDEWWGGNLRKEVLRRKIPRKIFVQANTFEKDGRVILKEYEPSLSGMIQSFAERDV